ncbi:oxidoreductase [Mycobacterium kansasii]|uniref:Fatty acyl-CoA reductase n=1 Tax=Mycobacterium attenuatum TaxID=2341086 RepID=A0A498PUG4_9MYCO|nr:oxidoreductase [Mycobacterium attenuatum]ORB85978.1 oxidoreductase [Mycobacterium kansasii]VBA36301.1 Fatty acyl-CoA reductase [Mycobacterium attenuatum]VBA48929.1 Fatty acyl-CoA reductase [Mycobacterium attenuatum]VBA54365.1 Fatty acyl-CoA reductase [Mycobacterium attenuatum]
MAEWTAASLPSFVGRTVIVTGANSGLGEVTARALARVGAHVILAVRDTAKGEAAARRLADAGTRAEVRRVDLQDLSSVRDFADDIDKVDVLVNNAGIMAAKYSRTVDGFEGHMATNHLGHFALTNLLLPKLTDRVVTVSSLLHNIGYISLSDLNWQSRRYSAWLAYGQSKLANLLFTSQLQRRLDNVGSSVRALAAHPGWSHTNLQGNSGRKLVDAAVLAVDRIVSTDADFGARQTLYAISQDLPGNTFVGPRFGLYGRTQPTWRNWPAKRASTAVALWELSERLTGAKFPL